LENEAPELIRKAIDLAKGGDVTAMRICLDRVLPVRRNRPLSFKIEIPDDGDAAGAFNAVLSGPATGQLIAEEALTLCGVVEARLRVREHSEIVSRLEALEAKL
jgi:hypothetical protein